MSLRRQKPKPPAATGSRLSDVLAIGLANGAAASVAKIKREEYAPKATPQDIADSLSEVMQQLEVECIEMKRTKDAAEVITLYDDDDDDEEPSTSSPRNMRRAPPALRHDFGRRGIAENWFDNENRKNRTHKKMARMLYVNYRLVTMPGDEPNSDEDLDEDLDDLVTEDMKRLVTNYRKNVAEGANADEQFQAMYSYLAEYTYKEVEDSATSRVALFVEQAYANQSNVAAVTKPVLQVVSTDDDATAKYQLYLEKASERAMQIRVEVPGMTKTWTMAPSSRLAENEALHAITALVLQYGVVPASEFSTDTVESYFRGHLSRQSADED